MTLPQMFTERFGDAGPAGSHRIVILYDGACPFCSSYVTLLKLRQTAAVTLVDARGEPVLVEALARHGISLDDGMLAVIDGEPFHGAKALAEMAALINSDGLARSLNKAVFSSPLRSRLLYPLMKAGRAITLKTLGKSRL